MGGLQMGDGIGKLPAMKLHRPGQRRKHRPACAL
jgi:hypothetical protein